MNFRRSRSGRTPTEVNLTPLIDIVFQLLIFFLITTTFVQNPGIEVDLPKANTDSVQEEKELLTITITPEGRIIYEGEALTHEDLKTTLSSKKETHADSVVIIQADQGTPHGKVVGVMDVIRQIGFLKLAIATAEGE